MENKISVNALSAMIALATGQAGELCEKFLTELFTLIADELANGESVRIKGLGTFKIGEIETRKSVDVGTGEEIEIPAHKRVIFVAAKDLAASVNAPFEAFEAVEVSDSLPTDILIGEWGEDEEAELLKEQGAGYDQDSIREDSKGHKEASEDADSRILATDDSESGDEAVMDDSEVCDEAEELSLEEDDEAEDDDELAERCVEGLKNLDLEQPIISFAGDVSPLADPVEAKREIEGSEQTDASGLSDGTPRSDMPDLSDNVRSSTETEDSVEAGETEDSNAGEIAKDSDASERTEESDSAEKAEDPEDLKSAEGADSIDEADPEGLDRSEDSESFEASEDVEDPDDSNAAYGELVDEDDDYEKRSGRFGKGFFAGFFTAIILLAAVAYIGLKTDFFHNNLLYHKANENTRGESATPSDGTADGLTTVPDTDDTTGTDASAGPEATAADSMAGSAGATGSAAGGVKTDSNNSPVVMTSGGSADGHGQAEEVATRPSDVPVYDIVSTTRYLTTMAQQHYGDFNFWPIIYKENQAILGHPDRIKPGTKVVVPPLSKYNVDPANPEDVKRMKREGSAIYAKYK